MIIISISAAFDIRQTGDSHWDPTKLNLTVHFKINRRLRRANVCIVDLHFRTPEPTRMSRPLETGSNRFPLKAINLTKSNT